MSSTDPFEHHDGAYVLGALDESDRRAFELHLETCPDCQARVAEIRSTAELLAGLPASAFEDPTPMPETLLPGLLRRADRERTRRRWFTASVGAVAAACLAALVVIAWPGGSSAPKQPAALAFAPVRPSPVTASAQLVSKAWGTEIDLRCKYGTDEHEYVPYNLVVVGKNGHPYPAGSWTLAPGQVTTFTGGAAINRAQIDKVEITLANGTPILQLDV